MPVRRASTTVAANTTLTTTTETEVAELSAPAPSQAGQRVTIAGWCQLTTGAGTTTVTPRIRRGTDTGGTLIGEGNPVTIGAAAGGTEVFSITVDDTPGELSSLSYVLTLQQAGATGNGTALLASLIAEIGP